VGVTQTLAPGSAKPRAATDRVNSLLLGLLQATVGRVAACGDISAPSAGGGVQCHIHIVIFQLCTSIA